MIIRMGPVGRKVGRFFEESHRRVEHRAAATDHPDLLHEIFGLHVSLVINRGIRKHHPHGGNVARKARAGTAPSARARSARSIEPEVSSTTPNVRTSWPCDGTTQLGLGMSGVAD